MRKDRLTATIIGLVVGIAGTLGLKGCSLPIPTPFNPPVSKGEHVVIVVDDTAPSIPTGIILDCPRLRSLKAAGKCAIYGLQESDIKRKNYPPLITQAGGAPALLVLSESGDCAYAGRLPTDQAALETVLTKHVKDLPPPAPAHAWPTTVLNPGSETREALDAQGRPFVEEGGHRRFLTAKQDTKKFRSLKKYGDSFPVFPEKEWYEVNREGLFAASNDDSVSCIYDQDGHGSCVGQGWAGALRRARVLAGMKDVKLAPTYLYSLINGNQDNGAIISDGIEALTKYGTCTYKLVGQDKIYQRQMPSGAKAEALRFKLDDAYRCDSWEETCSALLTGRYLVVFGIQVGNTWGRFDKYGVSGHDRGPGNHCIAADGLRKLDDGRWVLCAFNSWGDDWGPFKNGRVYQDKMHLFGNGDQPDVCVIRRPGRDPQEPYEPPAYKPKDAEFKLAF